MGELTAVLLISDADDRAVMQMQVEATAVAKVVETVSQVPASAADPLLRRLRDLRPSIVIIQLQKRYLATALRTIELLHSELPDTALFGYGETSDPQIIISAMRAGAVEFLERPSSVTHLLDALMRVSTAKRKSSVSSVRGKIYAVMNAKGGSGATTVAVNTALALQHSAGDTVLIDFATLGHVALHLNLRPQFTVGEAFANLQRMDSTLMSTFLTSYCGGMQVLAGTETPHTTEYAATDVAKLLDIIATKFRNVVVDLSNRVDAIQKVTCDMSERVLLVAQPDVASLWSAAKLQGYLAENGNGGRVQLIVNRARKIPGFDDDEIEATTRLKVLQRVPGHFLEVAASIDRGIPVAHQKGNQVSRSFHDLVQRLTGKTSTSTKRKPFSLFGVLDGRA